MTGKAKNERGAAAGEGRRGENRRAQMIKGVLELALLRLLQDEARYGLEILQLMNAAGLEVADGTIYPLLHRMEAAGFVAAEWRIEGEGARPRKYYALTPAGAAELKTMSADWRDLAARMAALLGKEG
jgi:PadR family transcriptional regulator, regulatory protein PadR